MTGPQKTSDDTARMLSAAGIVVTEEGRRSARAKLHAVDARMTDEKWDELRGQVRRYANGS